MIAHWWDSIGYCCIIQKNLRDGIESGGYRCTNQRYLHGIHAFQDEAHDIKYTEILPAGVKYVSVHEA